PCFLRADHRLNASHGLALTSEGTVDAGAIGGLKEEQRAGEEGQERQPSQLQWKVSLDEHDGGEQPDAHHGDAAAHSLISRALVDIATAASHGEEDRGPARGCKCLARDERRVSQRRDEIYTRVTRCEAC